MEAIIKVLISYLLGSISGSLVVGKFKGVDIRQAGSGNAGGTNAFRTQGIPFALAVVVIDIGKGYVAAAFIPSIHFGWAGLGPSASIDLMMVTCGVAAIVGHVFPIFFGFNGGKGAGTAVGMVAAVHLVLVPWMILIWVSILISTGFVGLATMVAGVSVPILILLFPLDNPYLLPFSIAVCFFLFFTHRSNIQRMLHGVENRFEKAMIFRKP